MLNDSPVWSRVQGLRPKLARHLRIVAQAFRGERWYLLQDEVGGRHLRLNRHAYEVVTRFEGNIKVANILERLTEEQGEDAPNAPELIHLLQQLDGINALEGGLPGDVREMLGMPATTAKGTRGRRLSNPLALRFPLVDPDRLLTWLQPYFRWVFSLTAATVWLLALSLAVALAVLELPRIENAVNLSLLSPRNLVLVWLIFPLVKIVHELAHGLAVKHWGGEVHEMGISLLVLVPVPYVDASASWMFRDKHQRVLVAGAGIVAELFLAAIATLVWMAVEPGLIRDISLNVMLIASISTLFINGNPLLRFDGYYILQDLVEIPNLASRSSRYCLYLLQRYLLRLPDAYSPVTGVGERGWLFGYGVCAAIYRLFILAAIALFLAGKYLIAGVALASWAVLTQLIMPLLKATRFLLTGARLQGRRAPALAVCAALIAVVVTLLGVVPVRYTTAAQGVVWLPAQSQIYAQSSGFVTDVLVASGAHVTSNTPVLQMDSPHLQYRRSALAAQREELAAVQAANHFTEPVKAQAAAQKIASLDAEFAIVQNQLEQLTVVSPAQGTFVWAHADALRGRHVAQGDLIGFVVDPKALIVRCVVTQDDIGRLHAGTDQVQVRLAENLSQVLEATIMRQTPSADRTLPSAVLAASGGGALVTRSDGTNNQALEEVFHIDLALPPNIPISGLGARAYVRFQHSSMPLAQQWMQRARQLLLSRLAV